MFDKRLLILLLMFFVSKASAQYGDSFPILKFDIDTADFGLVNEGDTVRYDFWFTNTGTKALVIKQAYPACGCTYPTFTHGIIRPGERGNIHVEFHSKGFGGDTVLKEVIIISNGPENYARFKAIIINKTILEDIERYKKSQESLKPEKLDGKKKRKKRAKDKKMIKTE